MFEAKATRETPEKAAANDTTADIRMLPFSLLFPIALISILVSAKSNCQDQI
jgi:hypothetical protein